MSERCIKSRRGNLTRYFTVGATTSLLVAISTGNVSAQSTASGTGEVEAVVVTGTRIKGVAPAGSSVISLGDEQIKMTGAATTNEFLRQLPQVFNLGIDEAHFNANQGAGRNVSAGSGLNLRGLGTNATLVLIDGRRTVADQNIGALDVSSIPASAVAGIEVMADGGSAIYGSDAVGGVVNVLLRRPFEGAEVFARYGGGDEFDQYSVSGVFGTLWSGGGVMIAAERNERDSLPASARKYYSADGRPYGGPDLRSNNARPGTISIGSTRYAIPQGQDGRNLTAADLVPNTFNLQDSYEGGDVLPTQERTSAAVRLEHAFSDRVRMSSEALYAKRDSDRKVGAGSLAVALTVPRTNPYFVHPTNPAAANVTVNYNLATDLGVQHREASEEVVFLTADLDVDFGASWTLNTFGSYSYDEVLSVRSEYNSVALAAALADSNPATAFNPFGDGSHTSAATIDALRLDNHNNFKPTTTEFGTSIAGSLFELPGGEVKMALGGVYRRETQLRYGGTTLVPVRTSADRTVKSAFAELFVPVIGTANSIPWAQQLALSIAGRQDEYSDAGGTFNPKYGVVWEPLDGVKLRASYGTSFRAPAPADPATPLGLQVRNFTDPTSATGQTRTLLVRAGPTDYLEPETATIFSAGLDFTPASIDGLSISLTYFDIDYKDRIEDPGNNTNALLIEDQLSEVIIRNPSIELVNSYLILPEYTGAPENPANVLAIVDGRFQNIGRVKTSGIETQTRYRWDRWRVGVAASYVLAFEKTISNTAPLVDFSNKINFPLRLQGRGEIGWGGDTIDSALYVNYANSYTNDIITPSQDVDAHWTFDLALRYHFPAAQGFTNGLTLSLDATNLLDEDPPYVSNNDLQFDPQVASALGRVVQFGVRKKF